MSNLTPAARVALASIKAALDALDDSDWNAVARALGVYRRPVPLIPPGLDLDSRPSIPPVTKAPEAIPAPPRIPGGG